MLNKARLSFKENNPSKQIIINRAADIQNAYDSCLVFSGVSLILTMIFMGSN